MSWILPVIGIALAKGLFDKNKKAKYPHMMYNCNTGEGVEVFTPAEHNQYKDGGFVHDLAECPLDSTFGRDYGDFDYDDSVDDLESQDQYTEVYSDPAFVGVAIYKVMQLNYDPARGRRGYYQLKYFVIAESGANGRPSSFNYDGDRKRTFSTLEAAKVYYDSIGPNRPTNPKKPEGDPMPPPMTPDDDDSTPTPTPVVPDPPMPPMMPPSGGFGSSGTTVSFMRQSSHGGEY